MRAGADIGDLRHQPSRKLALHVEIPLLHVGCGRVPQIGVYGRVFHVRRIEGIRGKTLRENDTGIDLVRGVSAQDEIRGIVGGSSSHRNVFIPAVKDAGGATDHRLRRELECESHSGREVVPVGIHEEVRYRPHLRR